MHSIQEPTLKAPHRSPRDLAVVAAIHLFESDLGRAFVYQMFPIVLLQLIGFYLFGLRLLQNRLSALVLALVSLPGLQVSH